MKLLYYPLIAIILFSSCSPNYHNKIVARSISQQCKMLPLNDSIQKLLDAGLVHITSTDGNPEICDSVYTVTFTTYQKWKSGNKLFLFSGIVIAIIGFGAFIKITSGGNTKPWTIGLVLGTLFVSGMLIGGFYYFSTERDIRKADYIQMHGDLKEFWDTPAKSY